MYALIQTSNQGSVWRSDDAGTTWKVVSWDRSLIGRAGYYIRMVVNPQNPDDIFVMSSSMHRSQDGGKNFSGNGGQFPFTQGQASCGDCHDVWIDPKDPVRYITVDDGGSSINTPQRRAEHPDSERPDVPRPRRQPRPVLDLQQSSGRRHDARTGDELGDDGQRLPAREQHHAPGRGLRPRSGGGRGRGVAAPPEDPACAGPGRGRTAPATAWQPNIGGCESGFTIPDPTNADIVYASCYGNKVTKWDARTGTARSIQPWMVSLDSPPNETKYRCHWTSPMAIDPFDTKNVLYACQMILKTNNGGQSWSEFSPDLSTKDPSRIVSNGGIVGDNLGQYNGEVVWSLEYLEDPAGPDLGRHQRRQDVEHAR